MNHNINHNYYLLSATSYWFQIRHLFLLISEPSPTQCVSIQDSNAIQSGLTARIKSATKDNKLLYIVVTGGLNAKTMKEELEWGKLLFLYSQFLDRSFEEFSFASAKCSFRRGWLALMTAQNLHPE